LYIVYNFFGLKSIEELICVRQNRFVAKYVSSETVDVLYNKIILLIMIMFFLRLLPKR